MLPYLVVRFKVLESTGNHKTPPSPQNTILNSYSIISDLDPTTLTRVGRGEGPLHYQIHRLGVRAGGAGSKVWNRVYMIAPVKKFGRVRLSTNLPSKQIWRRMRTLKDDEFLLGFTFYGIQTSRKGFQELFSWNFWISGGVMYEQFMSDFAHHDSAPWQVQLFISFVNFRATSLRAACSISYIFFHLRWY